MKHIKTIEEAWALPEINIEDATTYVLETRASLDYEKRDFPSGETVLVPIVRKLTDFGMAGDDIYLFVDEGGKRMRVVYTEDGAKKVRLNWGK